MNESELLKAYSELLSEVMALKKKLSQLEDALYDMKNAGTVSATFEYTNQTDDTNVFNTPYLINVTKGSFIPKAPLHEGAVWIIKDKTPEQEWDFSTWRVVGDVTLKEKR